MVHESDSHLFGIDPDFVPPAIDVSDTELDRLANIREGEIRALSSHKQNLEQLYFEHTQSSTPKHISFPFNRLPKTTTDLVQKLTHQMSTNARTQIETTLDYNMPLAIKTAHYAPPAILTFWTQRWIKVNEAQMGYTVCEAQNNGKILELDSVITYQEVEELIRELLKAGIKTKL